MTEAAARQPGDQIRDELTLALEPGSDMTAWSALTQVALLRNATDDAEWWWTARLLDIDDATRKAHLGLRARTHDSRGYVNGYLSVVVDRSELRFVLTALAVGTAGDKPTHSHLTAGVAASALAEIQREISEQRKAAAAALRTGTTKAATSRRPRRAVAIGVGVAAGAAMGLLEWLRRNPNILRR